MHKRIPRLIVMVGLSASGKSSYAKELEKENPTNTIVISSDAIREEICGSVEDQSKNGEVFRIFHERIRRNLENGAEDLGRIKEAIYIYEDLIDIWEN